MTLPTAYSRELAQAYNARHFGGPSGQLILKNDIATISALLPPPPATVLDIPCGTGIYTSSLQAQGYNMIAVDASLPMLQIADLASFTTKIQGNITRLPFKTDSLDAVISLRLFSHFQPNAIVASLRELHRVIKPNGRILFDSFRWSPRHWPLLRQFLAQEYIYTYSPAEARRMIAAANLKEIETAWHHLFSPIWQRKLPLFLLRPLKKIETVLPDQWLLRTFWACTKES